LFSASESSRPGQSVANQAARVASPRPGQRDIRASTLEIDRIHSLAEIDPTAYAEKDIDANTFPGAVHAHQV
jgi:hypothetical protein